MNLQPETAFAQRHLEALHRVGKLVTASLDLEATLEAIVEAAHQLTHAESTAILLLDQEELVIRVGHGMAAGAVGERVRVDAGVVGRALRTGQPVLVPDMLMEPGRARPDLDMRSGLRAYLAAPLLWRGERLGVVTAGAPEPGALGPIDVRLIGELADQAAAAVAHAGAYAREQARRAEIEGLYRELATQAASLEQAQRHLIATEKLTAIGQLAHGMAHEMNTPLGVVISNLAVLERYAAGLADMVAGAEQAVERLRATDSSSPVAEELEKTLKASDAAYILSDLPQLIAESAASADRIAGIVRSLATFARRDQDRPSATGVEEVLESAVTLSWNALKDRAAVVRVFGAVPPVLGHPSELAQVFVHVLLNAAQALEGQQGTVTLGTQSEGDWVVVTVADTGCGIAPEHLSRVFDPFFTTRSPGRGTGMGLAVCHGLVARHGGTISLDSVSGRGTTVTVRLPAAAQAYEAEAA